MVHLDILVRSEGRDRWTGAQLVVQIQRRNDDVAYNYSVHRIYECNPVLSYGY